ncbi:MAG: hypothetical protein A4S17_03845 [Proteobacteria bacterium HN_bin10]|nr:MAG: hypothetical protein A4S17_03845 [Proteobacteria bacterium HN_bin10]
MTPIKHAMLVMERTYKATPTRVFAAWEDKEARERWQAPDDTIQIKYEESNFRQSGRDVARCIEQDGGKYLATVNYLDIRREERIVFSEAVTQGNAHVSAALVCVELCPVSEGTRQLVTIQIAAFDGSGMEKGCEHGWGMALDNITEEFEQ